ncbi:TPA: ribosome-associated translation inhibitor RaiA [Candidatus Nomurabacteria bacterium]|nr:MAG: hypothetical protein O210_OD1C00001G0316 [Parcubacteria bacterium RAAC4_OD1_1]HCY26443.1 ribosome-associated translation inhibitor RaiA [Candidatus Nomurabacteria bacterium]
MIINIKATNMELTPAIEDYINKKLISLEKFNKDGEINVYVEVGKTTNHHKQGELFKSEINLSLDGKKFFTNSEKEDLYKAIDRSEEDIVRQITSKKDKSQTLFKRGSMSVKKMLKGFSKRNPFTSK